MSDRNYLPTGGGVKDEYVAVIRVFHVKPPEAPKVGTIVNAPAPSSKRVTEELLDMTVRATTLAGVQEKARSALGLA